MKKVYDIHERIYKHVISILRLIKQVPKNNTNQIIIKQLVRAITSVGANDREADGVSTKADFIHCYTVVRKELKESIFWLRIIGDLNSSLKTKISKKIKEGEELVKIISKIIINARKKIS